MKLTVKLSLVFLVVFFVLFGSLLVFVGVRLSHNINKIENTTMVMDVERVEDILKNEIGFHSRKQKDWSSWDDTYHFADDLNPEYIESNQQPESLKSLETQLMLFYDESGIIKHGIKLDDSYTTETPFDTAATELVYLAKQILEKKDLDYFISGITKIDGANWIISARPILTSDIKGPINGVLIFGSKWLDQNSKTLATLSKRKVDISPYDEATWQKLSETGVVEKTSRAEIGKVVSRDSDELISGYTLVRDIDDQPVGIMHVQANRLFNNDIIPMMREIGLSILVLGILCLIYMMIVIRVLIVKRLEVILDFVDSVRFGGITTARLGKHGKDEISKLSQTIDQMLNSLFKMKD